MKTDPRIDAYIAKQADFARPILEHVRAAVHEACPDVEETLKWSMPTFLYGGGILCGMAAFKQHASFGYWKHALVVGEGEPRDGMGSYGKLTSVKELPPKKTLIAHIKRAMQLNLDNVKSPAQRKTAPKPPPEAPEDLLAALKKNAKARKTFEAFPPSAQRDYVEWIIEAKREETRKTRLAQAVEWLAEGKRRNWKYENC
ncbi:YdeI/OmpD-associated family protein [Lysobacter sp. KIS68-7]|uniref:YdeI/OmpD-associated family protein n=1 Tax=Lysobacter sp. KIS68-7 TaxID=2904252 RepID=UPI001E4E010B|nr:YdeI/OmpD-associated family protein [Lysobacter sp. KIS68-7]UHQ19259.1 YdeI/OmpD-associated family protein [Lysobacter sp. KIS68-7]